MERIAVASSHGLDLLSKGSHAQPCSRVDVSVRPMKLVRHGRSSYHHLVKLCAPAALCPTFYHPYCSASITAAKDHALGLLYSDCLRFSTLEVSFATVSTEWSL